ncbi:MAG: hypothetical protein ABJA84_10210, partial [Polaromonas sp.]
SEHRLEQNRPDWQQPALPHVPRICFLEVLAGQGDSALACSRFRWLQLPKIGSFWSASCSAGRQEVTFEEARAHLGVETQRQWSDKAIARTTPCLLGLYSVVTLAAQNLFSTGQLYRRCAAWYPKPQATFCDTIACVRRDLWSHAYFSTSPHESDIVKIPRPLVDRFIDSLCYAA